MTTEYLREFLVLSQAGSFNRAAAILYIAQPVLTRHIQELEKEFGAQLFTRSSRGSALTEAGMFLARQLPDLLESCDNASTRLLQGGIPIRGKLRVACSHELSYAAHIRSFISGFLRRYRDLDISFEVVSGALPTAMLYSYDVVLSPCRYPETPPDTQEVLLQRHTIYAYLYPGHRLMSRQSVRLEELAGETILVPYAGEAFGPYARNWQLAERQTRGAAACRRVPNLATALSLLAADAGLILLATRYVRQMLMPDSAFYVPVADSDCCFEEYLYTPSYLTNGAAKLFHEELLASRRPAG